MTATNQPDRSPAPGIIPEPVHLSRDATPLSAATEKPYDPKPGRRNPVRIAVAKVMSALGGEKYMIDAYPAAGRDGGAASDDAGTGAQERWAAGR